MLNIDYKAAISAVALLSTISGTALAGSQNVVVLGSSSCPACAEAKEYLDSKGVNYRYVLIDNNASARAKAAAHGGYIPQLYINGAYIGSGVGVIEARF